MAHRPGRMSEDADYTLREMKLAMGVVAKMLEEKSNKEDLQLAFKLLEDRLSLKDIQPLMDEIQKKVDKSTMQDLCDDYHKRLVDYPSLDEYMQTLHILSVKIDALKDTVIALGQKMDGEDVIDLDTDYESTIKSTLK